MPGRPSGVNRATIIRKLIYRDGFKCQICKTTGFNGKEDMTIDHIIPVSRGGNWNLYNIRLAHKKCNEDRGNKFRHDDYYVELDVFREKAKAR